jgi:hypothetical protein
MAYDRYPHAIEGVIQHTTEKSHLVELTLGGKYWIPKKCIAGGAPGDPDEHGNRVFEVNDWWWKKRGDFEAE